MDKEVSKKWFDILEGWVERLINAICVGAITIQVIAILIMVFGRYFFSYVPMGTEELALFCMVWFSLLSISLSVRDDTHVKMEIVDKFLPGKAVRWIKVFSGMVVMDNIGQAGIRNSYVGNEDFKRMALSFNSRIRILYCLM